MRLLMVTYGRFSPELGGAQTAINLSAALRARGHDVITWAPEEAPPEVRWWNLPTWHRRELERFVASSAPFDAIDLPPVAVTPRLAAVAPLIARSIQPDLRYFAAQVLFDAHGAILSPLRFAAHLGHGFRHSVEVVRGWTKSRVILCLGTAESAWMSRYVPWTRKRLSVYLHAPSASDQKQFAELRHKRGPAPGPGVRFLWIGRWVAHKGIDRLIRFIAARLAENRLDSFSLAGCGSVAPDRLPAALARDPRLQIVPSFRRSELPELLGNHDAGLFTSTAEGWGLTLNEMLESGIPVFATPVGGVRDLAPFFPRTLRPFPPPRAIDLASLGSDDPEANGYYQHFTWEKIAERYEAVAAEAKGLPSAPAS